LLTSASVAADDNNALPAGQILYHTLGFIDLPDDPAIIKLALWFLLSNDLIVSHVHNEATHL